MPLFTAATMLADVPKPVLFYFIWLSYIGTEWKHTDYSGAMFSGGTAELHPHCL